MTETKNYLQLVDLWQKYNSNGLAPEVAQKAVAETLSLPWVQQLNVFSDQAVLLLELHTLNYLYKSPSMEKITGYPLEGITGANFFISLLPQEEFQTIVNINKHMHDEAIRT